MKVKHKTHRTHHALQLHFAVRNLFYWVLIINICCLISSSTAAASWTLKSGYRNDRLLELYETHQKLCSVNETASGQGVCIFMWDCHKSGGSHLGLCSIDSAIYGSCCSLPSGGEEEVVTAVVEEEHVTDNIVPVDETGQKFVVSSTTGSSSSTSSTTILPALGITEEIEIIPDYSEEDEHQPELDLPHVQNETNHISVDEESEKNNPALINQSRCGISKRSYSTKKLRIIGGMDSKFAAWPWMVSVRRSSLFGYSSTHSCGGVLINDQWIVTAAHCVFALSKSLIRVRFGDFDFKDEAEEELPFVERPIDKRVIHPAYNFTSYENDLALLKLQQPIEFSLHISPICLPLHNNNSFVGENGTISGWGRLSEGGRYSQKLQQVDVPILSNTNCMNLFKESGRVENIPDNFICAGYAEGGKDGCQGDSGGPLQILSSTGDRWFLAGVMSWGVGCGEPKAPGVYTRITKFTEWILQQVTSTE